MASHPKATDLPALLAKLCDAGVEFIIVGGAACVIQGAPITTNDLDIVHRRTPENIERLLELLLQLDATMRYDFANRALRPTAELLAGKGHLNLSTSLGPLDPLCELDGEARPRRLRLDHLEHRGNRSPGFSTRIRIPETIRYLKRLNFHGASKIAL